MIFMSFEMPICDFLSVISSNLIRPYIALFSHWRVTAFKIKVNDFHLIYAGRMPIPISD